MTAAGHRFPAGPGAWSFWRDAVLRTTGFPADGLDLLAGPECAKVADAHLAGQASAAEFAGAFSGTLRDSAAQVNRIAADTLFREAITWQNPAVITLCDALRRSGPTASRNTKRRYREQQLSRYWQRYCAKTETIGFFGPALWLTLAEQEPDSAAVPGDRLLDTRRVFLEPWALAAYGAVLAADPRLRRWLPPAPMPHYYLDHDRLRRPGREPVPLTAEEAAAIGRCDGRRPAADIAAELSADPSLAVPDQDSGLRLIASLAARRLLSWDANMPVSPHTEAVLRTRIAVIADDEPRRHAETGLDRLTTAAGAVAGAAGDPAALATALTALDAEFTAVTGAQPRRRQGQAYAGRGVCYEDTTRDLRVVIGRAFLDEIAPALTVMLQAARWVTSELRRACDGALESIYREKAASGRQVLLSDLWEPALELFHGAGERPADGVLRTLTEAWESLFGLAADPGARWLRRTTAELWPRARQLFAADRPGWSLARIHSPDLHVCAGSVGAINSGDFLAVLGEMHIAHATLAGHGLTWPHPDPGRVGDLAVQDFGQVRMLPLFPATWTRDPGRLVQIEPGPADLQLGFTRARGVDGSKLIPTTSVPLFLADGQVRGRVLDGRTVPLAEFFAFFLSKAVINAFRKASGAPHTPRVSLDKLVVFRETWRLSADDLDDLAAVPLRDEAGQYLAARGLARELRLPDRCFVKISTEAKPFYVDFTSPLYVASFCSMLRVAKSATGEAVRVTITEMLPTPEQTWVPDRDGRRYFGEIRMHITDPAAAG